MDSKPFSRAASIVAFVISKGWMRFTAFWTSGLKSWTPRDMRLRPRSCRCLTLSASQVRGSTSIENSPPWASGKRFVSVSIMSVSSSLVRKVGVPPPKWSCSSSVEPVTASFTRSASRPIISMYSALREWSRVTILLQPQ